MSHRPILVSMVLTVLAVLTTLTSLLTAKYFQTASNQQVWAAVPTKTAFLAATPAARKLSHPPTPTMPLLADLATPDATVAGLQDTAAGERLQQLRRRSLTTVKLQPSARTHVLQPRITASPKASPSPTPTKQQVFNAPTPTPSPSESLSQRSDPQPIVLSATPLPSPRPTPQPAGLNEALNQYREKNGLSRLESRGDLCDVSKQRTGEIVSNFSHQGFQDRINDGRLSELQYKSISENIWFSTGSYTMETIISSWDGSQGHKDNMRGDWTWGCGEVTNGYAVFLFMR